MQVSRKRNAYIRTREGINSNKSGNTSFINDVVIVCPVNISNLFILRPVSFVLTSLPCFKWLFLCDGTRAKIELGVSKDQNPMCAK